MKPLTLFSLLLVFIFASCKSELTNQDSTNELGDINIDVTANDAAKSEFHKGLLLMHSFEYDDAATHFKEAQDLDPTFGLAYWGEAMTKNHPLWREQEQVEALEILNRFGNDAEERLAKLPAGFEYDLFKAAEVLYGPGTKKERDQLYMEYMEKLHQDYPENHEAGALYALSILGAVKAGRDYEAYAKGARIAKSIINENPNHPGALHYTIHAYDDPENAPKAILAADRYAAVAPDATHALHMPSHIYVALGMWDKVISSNIASWDASVARMKNKDLDNDAMSYHALKWLMYGYLQTEQFDKAKQLVQDMQSYCTENPSKKAKSHLVMMKGAYFSETGQWDSQLVLDSFQYDDINITVQAVDYFNKGMLAYSNASKTELKNTIEDLSKTIEKSKRDVIKSEGTKMCSGSSSRNTSTALDIDRSNIITLELKALLAELQNNPKETESLLQAAVALEEKTSFMYGPPQIVKPSNELYAEWLLRQNRKSEAKKQFALVLERAPKRLIPTKGLSS